MIRLSELNSLIQKTLDETFRAQFFDVVAEIGQVNIKKDKKQAYFELVEKDENQKGFKARLNASLWRKFEMIEAFEKSTNQSIKAGMEILFRLQIQFHPVYGLSAEVIHIDPQYTIGALAQAREKTVLQLLAKHPDKIRLIDNQLHSYNQSLSLPLVVQNIALITAQQAEGGIDFLHELQNNRLGYRWNVVPFFATMQGDAAPESIKNAIIQIFKSGTAFDVIVLVRGGGAALDLHAFDHFTLAEVIARCPIPIFTGIGHTRNISLTDELAHSHFKAPTKVAEELIHLATQFEDSILELNNQLQNHALDQLEEAKNNLQLAALQFSVEPLTLLRHHLQKVNDLRANVENFSIRSLILKKNQLELTMLPLKHTALNRIGLTQNGLKPIVDKINHAVKFKLNQANQRISLIEKTIESKNPLVWIKKGYARILLNDQVISSITQINAHDHLTIEMKDGRIKTSIESIHPNGE
ncbi:MAG: exodeoxyribonuclease large subunit [Bacteroidota bacterium]|jgi:exodeoxyribonuclease VII large subunit